MAGERKLEAGQVRGLLVGPQCLEFRAGDEPERRRRQIRLVARVCHHVGSLREALAVYCQRITTGASWAGSTQRRRPKNPGKDCRPRRPGDQRHEYRDPRDHARHSGDRRVPDRAKAPAVLASQGTKRRSIPTGRIANADGSHIKLTARRTLDRVYFFMPFQRALRAERLLRNAVQLVPIPVSHRDLMLATSAGKPFSAPRWTHFRERNRHSHH